MKAFFAFLLLGISLSITAQRENHLIDSIRAIADTAKPTEQAFEYFKIGMLTRNMNIDTAYYYDSVGLQIAKEIRDSSLLVNGYNNMGLNYKQYGNLKKAKTFFQLALDIAIITGDSINASMIYNNLGVLNADWGNYDDALNFYLKSLKIDEKKQRLRSLSTTYNNIGIIHYSLQDYDLAQTYYQKALEINKKLGNKDGEALQLMNIGILHYFKNNYDSVFIHFKQAMYIWEKIGNLRRLAMIQSNLAEMYMEIEAYDDAIVYLSKSKKIYTQLKEVFDVIHTDLLMGDLYTKKGNYEKAKILFNEALEKAKQAESLPEEMLVYDSFKNLYKKANDYKKAFTYQEYYHRIKDSIFTKEKTSIIQEMETKYQTENMEQQLVLMEKENKLIELEKKRLSTILYFIIVLAALLIVLISFIIRAYRIKKRAFEVIREQKEEITAQRDMAREQNAIITKQKQAITDSITYAQRIQDAIIPGEKEIEKSIPNFFSFYLPKDVVSGDFYWVQNIDNKTLIALADCTGHGVPGAFMSMLGMSFLNEIAKAEKIKDAASILEKLRENIIESLRQKNSKFEQIDGMDMALVVKHSNETIEYAGARNPLYILSDKPIHLDNKHMDFKITEARDFSKKLYEVAADKMPVANYIKMSKFRNHTIKVNPNDQIVLFTDGITDQFGGADNTKYQTGNFKALLLEIADKTLSEQQKIINEEYFKWKGETDQIDDVSIFSFKI